LPKDFLNRIDLQYLNPLSTSWINQALGGIDAIADLLFETKLAENKALLYLLLEHKSFPDKFTPLQAHIYQMCIWWKYHRSHPGKKLPLIFTFVLHHGRRPYHYSKDLRDLIDAPRDLVDTYVLKPFHLLDLSQTPDEALSNSPELRAVELALKHIADKDILPCLEQQLAPLLSAVVEYNQDLAFTLLKYILTSIDIEHEDRFQKFIEKSIEFNVGEKIMNLLEWRTLKAQREIAERLLEMGLEDALIIKATQLNSKELVLLKQKKELVK
jgi:predicted transposase YdaD